MTDYQATIGLEVHVELRTRTKMFCDCPNSPDPSISLRAGEERPNVNVCPVCLGHPGTLPTINKQAVEAVIKTGLALGGTVNPVTKFDRKNYFYPDLPKGYQISQYDQPIITGGKLHDIRLRRVHLEEDTGRLLHEVGPSTSSGRPASLVDFNRAGVPLMELVTEPDIHSAEDAVAFAKELQLILRYLGISDADMEKGQMRVEANISLREIADERGQHADKRGNGQRESASSRRQSASTLGTKVEVKNINSFKAVHDAIEFELKRQAEVLAHGEKVVHETRGWDDAKRATVSQRSKEEAHDYRYFPEPDLPPFETKVFDIDRLRDELPELPAAKRERFVREFGLTEVQANLLVADKQLADFFEAAVSELATRDERTTSTIEKAPQQLLFNYLTSDLAGLVNELGTGWDELSAGGGSASGGKVNPEQLAHLVDLIADGKIGSRQAKDILRTMATEGGDPEEILRTEGLETISDISKLERVMGEIIAENPQPVADYKKGKQASLQFLIGKAMEKLKGRGNPQMLGEMLTKLIK
jgi:aspartyl-tRNA(Asn)/glutamyl-tRNA(Gln) amidotransferase subunit B